MAQTAVEWLVQELTVVYPRIEEMKLLTDKARHIEKDQIIKANRDGVDMLIDNKPFLSGQQYYNETFGK